MKHIFKSMLCIICACFLILIPYWIFFIRSVAYEPLLGMPMDNIDAFDPMFSSFIWSAFVGAIFFWFLHGRKEVQQAPGEGGNKKQLFLQTVAVTACIVAIGYVLERNSGRLSNLCGDIYFAISNTKQCAETGSIELFEHLMMVDFYFERTIIPDFQKMMNLLVVFLVYQGMRVWSAVRINNMAVVREPGE